VHIYIIILLVFLAISGCKNELAPNYSKLKESKVVQESSILEVTGKSLLERIIPPRDFERIPLSQSSFGNYLRTINLKPEGSRVTYFNGHTKPSESVYIAVVDLAIGTKDLHQCADAIMRLKAEYHWNNQEYDKIYFKLTNGFKMEFSPWRKGKRLMVDGSRTWWNNGMEVSNTYSDFWNYLEVVFTYAGTYSLAKELKQVSIEEMKPGDVFIKGGFPGHAVIVMDMAENKETGEKVYLLAQSYMPAQELQILINPNDGSLSPWYRLNENQIIKTPEWQFTRDQLKRFGD
jgi:hypothetical protein